MFKHYVEEHSEPLDWKNCKQAKWFIYYDYDSNCIGCDWYVSWKTQGASYGRSEQILKDASAYVGEENVKKYILGM